MLRRLQDYGSEGYVGTVRDLARRVRVGGAALHPDAVYAALAQLLGLGIVAATGPDPAGVVTLWLTSKGARVARHHLGGSK